MIFLLDESGNGNLDQPLIVGAVELGNDADCVEERIRELHQRLSASQTLRGLPTFGEFRERGFHSSSDLQDVSGPFLELMRTIFFKTYMLVTDRTGVPGETEASRIEFMYVKLLSDLLIRYRTEPVIHCIVEASTGMSSIAKRLPRAAAQQAQRTLGKRTAMPQLVVAPAPKGDHMSMAIIDYVMAAASRWIRADCPTDPERWPYRAYRDVEASISVLYSFEKGRISSRRDPLH